MNTLENKVALVTGGGRGIGAAVAVRLAEEGADVVLTYTRDEEAANGVVAAVKDAGRRAMAIRADNGDAESVVAAVEDTVATFGRLDVLVNNAGAFPVGPIEDTTVEQIDEVMAANVRGTLLATKTALRHMGEGSSVVSIGSNVIDHVPFPGLTLYATSKAALVGMTRGLARETGPRGITVSMVNPGPVDTDLNPADGPNADGIRGLVPLGRFARPEEIADMVVHLAGPGGRFVTGSAIDVNGGINA